MTRQSILLFTERRETELFRFSSAKKRGETLLLYDGISGTVEIIQFRVSIPAHLTFHQLKRRYNGANCKTWAGLLSGIVGMGGRHSCDNHPPCPALFITSLKFKR